MSYSAINTATQAVKDAVKVGLIKQAAVRSAAVKNGVVDIDQRELNVCKAIVADTMPAAWITMVLIELDIAGQLATATDAQIDTVITTGVVASSVASVWSFLIATR